jgi:MFS family permease
MTLPRIDDSEHDTERDSPTKVLTAATLPLYLGGFIGPFGTMIVISIYPELRESFGASTQAVNWAFSGYMIPLAVLLTVSGTIGERFGRRRVTQWTFVAYAIASFLCVVAPNLGLFLAARVLQGAANAFITPLLIAGLTEVTAPARLGRAIGVYSSFQAAGGAVAPFAGGLAAAVDWRLAFVAVGVVSLLLATRPPAGEPRPAASAPPIRPLFTTRMATLWTAAFTAAAGPVGLAVVVGLYLRDELAVGAAATGVVLLLGGVGASVMGPTWGRLLDSWGSRRASMISLTAVLVVAAPLGLITKPIPFAVVWMVAAGLVSFVVINLQQLAAVAVPANRGGAVSSVLAFRFMGHALGPLLWVPVFAISPGWTFAAATGVGLITMAALFAATAGPVPDASGTTSGD